MIGQIRELVEYIASKNGRTGVRAVKSVYLEGWVLQELYEEGKQSSTKSDHKESLKLKLFDPEQFVQMSEQAKHTSIDVLESEQST